MSRKFMKRTMSHSTMARVGAMPANFKRKLKVHSGTLPVSALATFLALCGLPQQSHAATYSWANGQTGNWNVTTSWGGGNIPVSGQDTVISFLNISQNAVTTNNLGAVQLNKLTMQTSVGSTKTLSIGGTSSSLNFVTNSSSVLPTLVLQNRGTTTMSLSTGITVTDALAITHSGTGTTVFSSTISNTGGITFDGSGTGSITYGSGVTSGTGGVTYNGSYTITASGTNTYTGVTTFGNGIVSASTIGNGGVAGNLGQATNAASNLVFNGGTLRYSGATATSNRAFTINDGKTATIDVSTAGSNLTIAGATGASSTGGLTKSGSGSLTLSGTNTYTGTTVVSAGTLLLGSSGSIANSSTIRVASGATLDVSAVSGGFTLASGQTLQNKGTFTGALTVGSGATFAPGNSPGTSTQAGNLTLATGSNFEWELVGNTTSGAGTNYDNTVFTSGGLTIQSGVGANLVFNYTGSTVDWNNTFWDSDQSWTLFSGASSLSTTGGIFGPINVGLDSLGQNFSLAGGSFSFSSSGNDILLNYTAVPEPSTYGLVAGGLAALTLLRRMRGRKA